MKPLGFPKQRKEPWSRVSRGGMVIDGNRRWLKPDFEQAKEFLEKEKDQEMELTME